MSFSTGDTSLRNFYLMTLGRPTAKLFNLCWYSIKGELCCRHSIGFHNLTLTWVKWCKIAIVSRTNLFKGNARVLKKGRKILKQIACFLCRLDLKDESTYNMKFNILPGPIYNIHMWGSLCAPAIYKPFKNFRESCPWNHICALSICTWFLKCLVH